MVETDDTKQQEILKLAFNEDPQFVYASRDLDELEKRMKQYASVSKNAQTQGDGGDAEETAGGEGSDAALFAIRHVDRPADAAGALAHAHRRVARVRRRSAAACPPQYASTIKPEEQAQMNIVQAATTQLHDDDGVLREGEKFMAKYPASMFTQIIRTWR